MFGLAKHLDEPKEKPTSFEIWMLAPLEDDGIDRTIEPPEDDGSDYDLCTEDQNYFGPRNFKLSNYYKQTAGVAEIERKKNEEKKKKRKKSEGVATQMLRPPKQIRFSYDCF